MASTPTEREAVFESIKKIVSLKTKARKKRMPFLLPGAELMEIVRDTGIEYDTMWDAMRWLKKRRMVTLLNKNSGWITVEDRPPHCYKHGIAEIKTREGWMCDKCYDEQGEE